MNDRPIRDILAGNPCSIAGCNNPHFRHSWCRAHWKRWRRHNDPLGGGSYRKPGRTCRVLDCGRKASAKDMCSSHYNRWLRHGDPLSGRNDTAEQARRYLIDVVFNFDIDECLTWPFVRNRQGYGRVSVDGRMQIVSRIVCEHENGPPPTPDHHAAHSCHRGHLGCVAKRHLAWKTASQNYADKVRP